ncbi:uncharacterized protein N0V89_012466 [Didymosphaeria variabile]|uniref:FAD/NAD(P)-binding domain-containing protein n=1 Tax=Didymosphaeria variabile TaxID=1932322 RepID=A0A9W8XAK5_9PLEO|nr:uncharacterized protein N0V89_012466 [Didymosphaeria variabile]KAJ4344722.1 hypothetical protein N0V89_012466 [Didymosphaeria variabile]
MGSLDVPQPDYDVLIIGAGLSGCYACYRMQQLNLKVKVLEAGSSVGGTWYWKVLDEWNWSEHFAPQEETERYIQFICDKYELWKSMQFDTRVKSAHWQKDGGFWKLTDDSQREYTTRFLITGIGLLSDPTLPNIPGVEDFKGQAFHTSRWPSKHVGFEGKNVGIIGVGATAIQMTPEIAKTAKSLTVFQRTPNWAIPLHNSLIDKEGMDKIRAAYPETLKKINSARLSFLHADGDKSIWDDTPEEREAFWEYLYAQPGFGFWASNYKETLRDRQANALVSEFVAKKIRQRVHDPWTADKLIPKTYGFGLRRLPMETNFYEAFNRPNEVTGAFDAIDIRGIDGHRLLDEWKDGPRTYLGITVRRFPNIFMSMGPHQAYGNIPASIEYALYIEPKEDSVQKWTDHVHELGQGLLSNEVDSWLTGVNKNVAGKQKRIIARYSGSAQDFRRQCNAVAGAEYETFELR